jgi:hypothetical protein
LARNRYINTDFWTDPYVHEKLTKDEKLLYLYLFTNDKSTISGCYEITLKKITNETDLTATFILKAFKRFEKDGKAGFVDGWIILSNAVKHQKLNPNIIKGIQTQVLNIPESIKASKAFQRLSKALDYINININTNINTNINNNLNYNAENVVVDKIIQRIFRLSGFRVNEIQIKAVEKTFEDKRFKEETMFNIWTEATDIWCLRQNSKQFTFPYLLGIVNKSMGSLFAKAQEQRAASKKKVEANSPVENKEVAGLLKELVSSLGVDDD